MAPRLASDTAADLPDTVQRPDYIRSAPEYGIVHIGLGAFARAHQAIYTDDAIAASGEMWGITGVSLRSPDAATRLGPQDGLYTASIRSAGGTSRRLIGAVRGVLVARETPARVISAIAAPGTHIVSITVTEKGYCRNSTGALDPLLADEHSMFRYLGEALGLRHRAGMGGLTLLSCDNLPGNGRQLQHLLEQHLERTSPDTAAWFRNHCSCPDSMVDRIVPATTAEDLDSLQQVIGLRDEAAVLTEPFSQWVIEDRFAGPRPRWDAVGAQLTSNVGAYETAKLRMLNGAHSALAYVGLLRGHVFVHQAINDPPLRALVLKLMTEEALPGIQPAPGQDLHRYTGQLLQRFANPALQHRLAQISMDGSQKIPQRWLQTLAFHQQQGRSCPAILAALAAWLVHIRGDRDRVDDPGAAGFAQLWREQNADGVIDALFGAGGMFASHWLATSTDRAALVAGVRNPGTLELP